MALAKREQTGARISQAKQALGAAEVMRGYSELKAPFAGIITQKSVDPGNLATPGAPLLVIEQTGSFQFEASLEESMLPRVRTGQLVEINLESLDRALTGRISEILPSVDPGSRTFLVKVAILSGPQIRSGLFGRLTVALGGRDAISLPADSVEERGQVQSVMLVSDGVAHRRLVTTGQRSGGRVEVLSGLSDRERVVYPRVPDLDDGARVEVRQ
jgi:membrane fusion protein, multidrug efflux system